MSNKLISIKKFHIFFLIKKVFINSGSSKQPNITVIRYCSLKIFTRECQQGFSQDLSRFYIGLTFKIFFSEGRKIFLQSKPPNNFAFTLHLFYSEVTLANVIQQLPHPSLHTSLATLTISLIP